MNVNDFSDFIDSIMSGSISKSGIVAYAKEYFANCGELDSLLLKMTARTLSDPEIIFTGDRGNDGLEEIKDNNRISIVQQKQQDRVFEAMGIVEACKDKIEQPQQGQALTCKTTFKDKIIAENKDEVLNKLHSMIDGKRGKNIALVIFASVEIGLILKPTYKEVKNEFGNIGAESGYNNYLNKSKFSDSEINGIKKRLLE